MIDHEKESIQKYLNKEIDENGLAKACFSMIQRLCGVVGRKLQYDGEDLAQEVWFLFTSKIVHEYNPALSLEGYVYEYARRHCLYLKGTNREINVNDFSIKEDADNNIEDRVGWLMEANGQTASLDEEGIHAKIKGEKLKEKSLEDTELLRKLPGISDLLSKVGNDAESLTNELIQSGFSKLGTATRVMSAVNKLEQHRRKLVVADQLMEEPKETVLPKEHQELRNIRMRMERTKPQFARDLGIHLASLDAYEYGRTKTLPHELLDRARELERNFSDIFAAVKVRYKDMKMSEIVEYWADKSESELNELDKLASLFGVTKTTVKRWMTNESRAELSKIFEIDKIIVGERGGEVKTRPVEFSILD